MPNNPVSIARRKRDRIEIIDPGHPKGKYLYAYTIPDEEHGSWNVYNNWFCRCPPCADANRDKMRRKKELENAESRNSIASDF